MNVFYDRFERHDHAPSVEEIGERHSFGFPGNLLAIKGATSAGRFITAMPAFSNAAIFSAAVPELPEMMAPAWPMRRPGGAV